MHGVNPFKVQPMLDTFLSTTYFCIRLFYLYKAGGYKRGVCLYAQMNQIKHLFKTKMCWHLRYWLTGREEMRQCGNMKPRWPLSTSPQIRTGFSKREKIVNSRVICSKPVKLIHIQNILPDFCSGLPILGLISDKIPSWRQSLPYVWSFRKSSQCQLLLLPLLQWRHPTYAHVDTTQCNTHYYTSIT